MSLSQRSIFSSSNSSAGGKSVADELKEILIDIRLLQKTCQTMTAPWNRPRKYADLTLEEAQNKQKSLLPRMRELAKKLSDDEFTKVTDDANKEAAALCEVTAMAPSFF